MKLSGYPAGDPPRMLPEFGGEQGGFARCYYTRVRPDASEPRKVRSGPGQHAAAATAASRSRSERGDELHR